MAKSDKKTQPNIETPYRGLFLSDIVSCEYLLENGERKHVLNGASISIEKGEIIGISGETRLELIVLIEILASMRAYYKGTAKLSRLGTQRKKKRIVDEIFYVDSPNMLQGGMNVLEQIMFAILQKKMNALETQKKMMDLLVSLGMKNLMLQKIDNLSYNQRIIVALLIGILSKSEVVIANIIDQEFEQSEINLLKNVADFAENSKKGLVIATMQAKLIGMTCENVAYVMDGKINCHEEVKKLCEKHDKVICVIKGDDYIAMKKVLENGLKDISCFVSGDMLVVNSECDTKVKLGAIYELLDKNKIDYDFVKINKGRVLNSFEELVKKRDL